MSHDSFISYAQNFEDVLLWRALKHVQNGFYIDVGANDPEEHSVTKAFYDANWHGINIEPMPSYHQTFLAQRPRDINLAVACGAEEGSITLFDTPGVNGWASTDPATATAHRAEGIDVVEVQVPLRTLNNICAEHVTGDIHFLKIDVEGFEGEVLRGLDLRRWRPWVLVIEATLPNSRVTVHEQWEHLVTPHDYHFAWFDGLNRYYVAGERRELMDALTVQANVFDDFIGHHLDKAWTARRQADEAAAEAAQQAADAAAQRAEADAQRQAALVQAADSEQRFRTAAAALREAERTNRVIQDNANAAEIARRETAAWAQQLEQQLGATYASTSWRITRPLRLAGHVIKRVRQGAIRRVLTRKLRKPLRWLANQQAFRRVMFRILERCPALEQRVQRAWASVRDVETSPQFAAQFANIPPGQAMMPQPVRKVLGDLQRLHSND